jgi:hypothetical protein
VFLQQATSLAQEMELVLACSAEPSSDVCLDVLPCWPLGRSTGVRNASDAEAGLHSNRFRGDPDPIRANQPHAKRDRALASSASAPFPRAARRRSNSDLAPLHFPFPRASEEWSTTSRSAR